MTADEINSLGTDLWGHGWKAEMASYLNINLRKVQRWASGVETIPDWVANESLPLIHDKIARLQLWLTPDAQEVQG